VLLAAGLGGCAGWIAEPEPAVVSAAQPEGAPVEIAPRRLAGEELRAALPARLDLSVREGRVYWRAGGLEVEIGPAVPGDDVALGTPHGMLAASWAAFEYPEEDPGPAFERLLEHARATGEPLAAFRFEVSPLAGLQLGAARWIVVREGALAAVDGLARIEAARAAQAEAIDGVGLAVEAATRWLATADLGDPARRALGAVLGELVEPDRRANLDLVPPGFARRLVRHGWLGDWGGGVPAMRRLAAAVREAETPRTVLRYASDAGSIEFREDAFGEDLAVLSTAERVVYTRRMPAPAYLPTLGEATLAVRLPPASDPLAVFASEGPAPAAVPGGGAIAPLSVALLRVERWIAAWDATEGFRVDEIAWRSVYPEGEASGADPVLPDALPPHLVIVEPDADVMRLITQHGSVTPVRDASSAEGERFLDEAARALPDAAHLDLVGEHLVVYVYDSPDPAHPELIGTREWSGDIHQTVSQTLATVAGGTLRGDCDDLSELVQAIARRQGKLAYLIGLPAHAAIAWAERRAHGSAEEWTAFVLHTGEPFGFRAPTLAESLERAYAHFGAGEVFDPLKIEVLLRFSGENTRSSWFLSHRIFADAAYAKTMIDVQRDWHFQTYHRGVEKMRALVDSGDRDPANFIELAGLYAYSGQYGEAVRAQQQAIERTDSAQSRLSLRIDLVPMLFQAERRDEARALAREIAEGEVPALEAGLGAMLTDPLLSLVGGLLDRRHDPALALDILASRVAPRMDAGMDGFAESIRSGRVDLSGWRLGSAERTRYQLRWYAAATLAALRATAGTPAQQTQGWNALARSVWRWLDSIAFHDLEVGESVLDRYALLGRYYGAVLGSERFEAILEAAAPPASADRQHTARGEGTNPLDADASWISISPGYWVGELVEGFDPDRRELDRARVARLAQHVERAQREARALGLVHVSDDKDLRRARLVAAIVAGDRAELGRLLAEVRRMGDRAARLEASTWLARAARFLSAGEFAAVFRVWREELDYKPVYFWIAWSAALLDAPDAAVLVARTAAEQHPDDPSFAAEARYLQERLGERRRRASRGRR
jgi:hypothetical protein